MAYTLSNKCAKNCCKRTILVQVIIVVTFIFGTHCKFSNKKLLLSKKNSKLK